MIFRRARFADVIERQLSSFAEYSRFEIAEVDERLAAYNAADRDEAEELYGDYVDAVETCTEILADIRDAYSRNLEEGIDDDYEREFNRAVEKRWKPFSTEIENR